MPTSRRLAFACVVLTSGILLPFAKSMAADRPPVLISPTAAASLPATAAADADATSSAEASVAPASAYVGTDQCFTCHRQQADAWHESAHRQAFEHVPEKYRSDAACLKCHVTGFGQPEGFVHGAEKDLSMVGCEACHGPGAAHIDAAQRFILATPDEEAQVEKQLRDSIVKTVADSVCAACHITQAHGRHPAYDGQPQSRRSSSLHGAAAGSVVPCGPMLNLVSPSWSASTSSGYSPGLSIKMCGGCHYDYYKQWDAKHHADLASMLSEQHRNNQSCLECHPAPGAKARIVAAGRATSQWIGAACESCHGPAREHIIFNRQHITTLALSQRMEQKARDSIRKDRPANRCLQCHVQERHQPHPTFDENQSQE